MKTRFALSPKLPKSLRGHAIASQEWERVLSSPGLKITAFDKNTLIHYCLVIEDENVLRSIYADHEKTIDGLGTINLTTLTKRISGKQKWAQKLAKELYLDPPIFHP